jgi:hypothetical protein
MDESGAGSERGIADRARAGAAGDVLPLPIATPLSAGDGVEGAEWPCRTRPARGDGVVVADGGAAGRARGDLVAGADGGAEAARERCWRGWPRRAAAAERGRGEAGRLRAGADGGGVIVQWRWRWRRRAVELMPSALAASPTAVEETPSRRRSRRGGREVAAEAKARSPTAVEEVPVAEARLPQAVELVPVGVPCAGWVIVPAA